MERRSALGTFFFTHTFNTHPYIIFEFSVYTNKKWHRRKMMKLLKRKSEMKIEEQGKIMRITPQIRTQVETAANKNTDKSTDGASTAGRTKKRKPIWDLLF